MTNGRSVFATQVHRRGKARTKGRGTEFKINTEPKNEVAELGECKKGVMNERQDSRKRKGGDQRLFPNAEEQR